MSSRKRILLNSPAVYHVVSRTAYQSLLFGNEEKEIFTRMLFQQATFSGLEVLGYCMMSNHIHLLLRVTPVDSLPDEVLLERYRNYYGSQKVPQSTYSYERLQEILRENGRQAEVARQRILSRMGDLPAFMRELKQRFTIWYNHKHANKGTIWAARYKSLIVENSAESLTRVAAYIDLNPVRAGLVGDPKDYRWCGYAASMGGNRLMRKAMVDLFGAKHAYAQAVQSYRLILFGKGASQKTNAATGRDEGGTISAERVETVIQQGGKVPINELLRVRVRYFSDGLALGSKSFVESVFHAHRPAFGAKRPRAGAALPSGTWGGLYSMRNLQRDVYS